jgi:hypothetical protein
VLAATNEAAPQVPDLADILITSNGRVILRPGAAGDPDVATLGRTLHVLLSSATTSLPLRLFVTSSISSERFKSVTLFADALSYYAVPGRAEHIQALYHRAAATAAAVPAAIVAPPLAPTRAAETPAVRASRGRGSNTLAWAFGIFGGVLAGTVSALWMWPVAPPTELTVQTTGLRRGEPATARRQDDWPLGRVPAGRRVKTSVAVASRTSASMAPTPISPSTTERPGPSQPLVENAAPSRPTSLPPVAPSSRSQPSAMTPPESSATTAPAAPTMAGVPVVDGAIYTDVDREVVPPVLLSKLPPPAAGTDSQVTNTVELVVDPSGRVQRVHLLDASTGLTDPISLQVYKLLRFTPATKDGQPVSFRYLLRTTIAAH